LGTGEAGRGKKEVLKPMTCASGIAVPVTVAEDVASASLTAETAATRPFQTIEHWKLFSWLCIASCKAEMARLGKAGQNLLSTHIF
jgi:hypothetical protein